MTAPGQGAGSHMVALNMARRQKGKIMNLSSKRNKKERKKKE